MNGKECLGFRAISVACVVLLSVGATYAQRATGQPSDPYAIADPIFDAFRLDAHVPGLVYGIVANARLEHVATFGVQELDSRRAVTPDSLFRIASMTKAFTALTVLKLRDEGRVRLDAAAEEYVVELRGWNYPTDDSPRIRVRDLLNHTGGMVTDDPWGDRQTSLPEDDFTDLLRAGVPFTRAPATAYEYSNLGYALLGRIVKNVSNEPYADTIARTLLIPLGMESSGFVADAPPIEQRALGYRWEDNAWLPEPTLEHGAFGAMGGMQTSANDYAKWVAFLLSAWPPRDGADLGPVSRASVRELAKGSNFHSLSRRYARGGTSECVQAAAYGMGMHVKMDCDLGFTLSHSGGYPGFGSHVLLLPDRGIGIFAFANRTYASPAVAVWEAALALERAGLLGSERAIPVSPELANAYRAAGAIYAAGDVTVERDLLAMNFFLDRSADIRAREIAALKARVGNCDTTSPPTATGALSGEFIWRCEHGRVQGRLLLAPTRPPAIQALTLAAISP
jgi:CubicO group peptidase (beta-lactamase class C family)